MLSGFRILVQNYSMKRYWWVNQNQTYRREVQGGYLWSPKRSANGARNPFYESMREVAPGDLIFSFMDTRILALGCTLCTLQGVLGCNNLLDTSFVVMPHPS
jgi:hypothetical protein